MSDSQIADEFGLCKMKCDQTYKFWLRKKALSEEIDKRHAGLAGDQTAEMKGVSWTLRLAARIHVTRILDIKKVYKAMGATAFWAVCEVALKAIKEAVGDAKYETLVVAERTGYRKITAVFTGQQPTSETRERAA